SSRARASTSSSVSRGTGPSSCPSTSASTAAAPTWRRPMPTLSATGFATSPAQRAFATVAASLRLPVTNLRRGRSNSPSSPPPRIGPVPDEITALIVDDHEVVREGLRLSLSRAPHIRIVGEAADGAAAVEVSVRRKPDVVIMDVRMPGMDGLEATKQLLEQEPNAKVLIFTAYSERSLLTRGFESGAKGYILKEAPHNTLVRAIEKVAEGEAYVDPALMPEFLAVQNQGEMLTGREREILQLLADGMSN